MPMMELGRTPLADRLILERARRDWSQEDLAREAGISPATVAKVEKGRGGTRARTLFKIASAFGLDATELYELVRERGGDA
jgi:transcriptional regulator with XRE-family HTH domain